jgi:hypothetical protein
VVEVNSEKADITRANHQIEALEDRIKVLQRELQQKDDQMLGMKQSNSLYSSQLEANNAEMKKLSKKFEGALKDISAVKTDFMNEQKEVSLLNKKNHHLQKEIEALKLSLQNSIAENSFEKKLISSPPPEREEERFSAVGYLIPRQAHEDMLLEMNNLKQDNAILTDCLTNLDHPRRSSAGIQTELEEAGRSEATTGLKQLRAIVVFCKELEVLERAISESRLSGEKHPSFENGSDEQKRFLNGNVEVSATRFGQTKERRDPQSASCLNPTPDDIVGLCSIDWTEISEANDREEKDELQSDSSVNRNLMDKSIEFQGTTRDAVYLERLAANLRKSLNTDPELFADIVSRNLNQLKLNFANEIDCSPSQLFYKEYSELLIIIRERAMRLTNWRPQETMPQEPPARRPIEIQQEPLSEGSIQEDSVTITKEEAKAFKILRQYHDHLISIVQSKPESKLYSQLLEKQRGVITDYHQEFNFPPSAQEDILFKYEDILALSYLPMVQSDSVDFIPNLLERPSTPERSPSPKPSTVVVATPKEDAPNEEPLVVSGIPNWSNRCGRMEKNLRDIDTTMRIFIEEHSSNMEMTRANFEKYASHSLEFKFGRENRPDSTRGPTLTDPNKLLLSSLTKNIPFLGKIDRSTERTPTGRVKKLRGHYKTKAKQRKEQAKEWGKRTEAKIIKNFAQLDIKKKKFRDEDGNRLSRRDASWNSQKPPSEARNEVLAKYNMDIGINEIKTSKKQKKTFGYQAYMQANSSLLPPGDSNPSNKKLKLK